MTSLLNRFTIVGILKECRIDLFPSHIKARFNIEIDKQQEITIYYSINKKFHKEKYKEFIDLIPFLHPYVNGYVWCEKDQYYCLSSNNLLEKLFISGNVLEKNEIVYFNAEYIKLTKLKNELSFSFEGIIIDHFHILNIVNDSPRMFYIENNFKPSEKVYNFSVQYNSHYNINNNKHYINKIIKQEDINNYLLEWNIINSDGD